MPSHGSLTRETNGDLYGLKKKSQKYITSFEWKKHWKRLYSLVWWLLCSLVPWVRSTCPMPFASIVLKGRRRSLPRRLLGLHFQAMHRLLRHFHDKLDETPWLLMHLSDSFCEWVCCNNLWCCNCVDSRRFLSYKFRKSNRCLLTLVPCLTISTIVWTRPFFSFAREIGRCPFEWIFMTWKRWRGLNASWCQFNRIGRREVNAKETKEIWNDRENVGARLVRIPSNTKKIWNDIVDTFIIGGPNWYPFPFKVWHWHQQNMVLLILLSPLIRTLQWWLVHQNNQEILHTRVYQLQGAEQLCHPAKEK